MKRLYIYILLLLASFPFIAGCDKMESGYPFEDLDKRGLITPYCTIESSAVTGKYVSGNMGTKALINSTTPVDTILCNFLVIDETNVGEFAVNGYKTKWEDAYVSEASISTVPDGSLRSISLQPERPYKDKTGALKTRMIGWYPRNCNLVRENQNYSTTQFKDFSGICEVAQDDKVNLRFTGLDGSKDIMVSDIREGSFNNNNTFNTTNTFTFKHYLSAIRVHAKADNSAQDLGAWGEIEKVVVINQPSACKITLPQDCYVAEGPTGFASVGDVVWEDETAKNPLVTTAIFGEKDVNNPNNLVAEEYPVNISGISTEKYLGYSLIKPNSQLWLQVHTRAGVYDVKISSEYTFINESSKQPETVNIFQSGNIYDIHLNFNTDGTISIFLLDDGTSKYYDLTTGQAFTGEDTYGIEHKWANCYIINSLRPSPMDVYDGFCFDATVIGNGDKGMLSFGAQSFYPSSAHISPRSADLLWETSPGLITQIELIFGYVRFKVAKDPNYPTKYKEGNAVIAVHDSNGKILWSWHIWITDQPQELTYTEGDGNAQASITVLDRNLGATAAKWEAGETSSGPLLETYGLYYQWGRKDPSMGPPTANYSPINMTTAPYYDYSSDRRDAAEVLRLPAPTLQDAVENPMYIILPTAQTQTYYFNWLHEKIDFLWGYDKNEGTNEKKTIYDPCPNGYKVSGGELGDLFSSKQSFFEYDDGGQKVTNNGTTIYFPYTGYKGVDRGLNSLVASWKYVGQKADYQSAVVSVYTEDEDYYMHRGRNYLSSVNSWSEVNVEEPYTGHQIEDHTNRRTAAPVRCVKDENHNRVMAFLTPDKYTVSSASDVVNFNLYAKSFGANIDSATLSVGYHLKDHGETSGHKEYVSHSWDLNDLEWTYPTGSATLSFKFDTLRNLPVNPEKLTISISETTGSIRFILHVKTADNINKISSTTISLATNTVEFPRDIWHDDKVDGSDWSKNTVFVGQPIDKEFRIYGASEPVKVEMIIDGNTLSPVDITSNLSIVSGSDYTFDYKCSTAGLSFTTKAWHKVSFKVTFANGSDIVTGDKWFKVGGVAHGEPVISVRAQGNYVIQNISNSQYVYDGGERLYYVSTPTYANIFNFESSGEGFKVRNALTSDYVTVYSWGYYLYITEKSSSSAAVCKFNYSDEHFTIALKPKNTDDRYWGITNYNSYVNPLSDANDNTKWWKIYSVEYDFTDVNDTPPSQQSGSGS